MTKHGGHHRRTPQFQKACRRSGIDAAEDHPHDATADYRKERKQHDQRGFVHGLTFTFIELIPANDRDQQLATFDEPHRPTLSRVCCIAWFGLGTYFEDSTGLSAVSFAASAATSALMAMILGIRRIMDFWDNCIDFCINSGCLAKYALPAGD